MALRNTVGKAHTKHKIDNSHGQFLHAIPGGEVSVDKVQLSQVVHTTGRLYSKVDTLLLSELLQTLTNNKANEIIIKHLAQTSSIRKKPNSIGSFVFVYIYQLPFEPASSRNYTHKERSKTKKLCHDWPRSIAS